MICCNSGLIVALTVILLMFAGCTLVSIQGDSNHIEIRDQKTEKNPVDTTIGDEVIKPQVRGGQQS